MSILKKTGAFALLDSLVRNGTQHIFGYPGGAILPLYDELYLWEEQNLVQHILSRHEQGAIHDLEFSPIIRVQLVLLFNSLRAVI